MWATVSILLSVSVRLIKWFLPDRALGRLAAITDLDGVKVYFWLRRLIESTAFRVGVVPGFWFYY